jgi:hypothetical protein
MSLFFFFLSIYLHFIIDHPNTAPVPYIIGLLSFSSYFSGRPPPYEKGFSPSPSRTHLHPPFHLIKH